MNFGASVHRFGFAIYDIAEDSAARERLATLALERRMANIGVPTFLIASELIVGFRSADTTGTEIRAKLDRQAQSASLASGR